MSQLLKHLDEADDASIPLLRNELETNEEEEMEMGLFTEEEINRSRLRKKLKFIGKILIPLLLFGIFLLASIKTYLYVFYSLKNQKVDYKIHSLSVNNAFDHGFDLSLNATVNTRVPWSFDLKGITIDILDLDEEESDNVIISTTIPSFYLNSGQIIPINLSNQSIHIKNPKTLANLINTCAKTKIVKIPLRIRTRMHPHWIPFTKDLVVFKDILIDLKKEKPAGNLSRFIKLKDLKMEESANDDLIITAKLGIFNPLPVSIDEIPKVSFKIYSEDEIFIGRIKVIEASGGFRKGTTNSITLQGHLTPSEDSKTSDAIGKLVTNHLIGKRSKIYLRGDSIEEEEASGNLNWLKSILNHVNVPIEIPGKSTPKASAKIGMFEDSIKRIDVKKILFALDPAKPNQIALDSDAEVHFNIPRFASMMRPRIESLTIEGRVLDEKGNFIAPLSVPNHQISSNLSKENSLRTCLKMDVNVDSLNLSNVESLMAEMLYSQDTTISVNGHSSVKTKMLLGKMTVPRVPFIADIKLPGLGRILTTQRPEIKNFKVIEINGNQFKARASILIDNPTEVTSLIGSMQLTCIQEDSREHLGDAFMENVSIQPGKNDLAVELIFPIKSFAFKRFFELLISGEEQDLIFQGVRGSEAVHPLLKNVLGAFVMKTKLTAGGGQFGKFVSAITLKRKGFNLIPEAFMTVSNPFPFPMKILSVRQLNVYAYKPEGEEVLITKMDAVPLKEPIIIPENVEDWVDEENPLPLEVNGNILRSFKALEMLFNKKNPVDAEGKKYLPTRIEGLIRSEMAGIELEFKFIKDRLPLYIEFGF